jgi:DNA-directed RNA polymerase subunit RPC12/RpoP
MVVIMCSVGGTFDVDMAEGPEGYVCTECGSQFKGIGKDPKCPKCSSDKVVKIG